MRMPGRLYCHGKFVTIFFAIFYSLIERFHMQRIIAVTLVLLVSGRIIPLYGQFIWHPDGQGGYNAGIQTSVQSGALGVGGIGGYSLWGVLDLNFSAEQFFLSDKLSNQSISASQVQPSATLIG